MCTNRTFWLQWEKESLAPYAVHSDHPWYARRSDDDDIDDRQGNQSRYRTAFEIDKDRITNSQSFRRLEYKTQVFVTHEGDNYRTRLTHTLEVAEIARHIARSLRLNEHLTEAIALGHDVGHAPYGHIAEKTINEWLKKLDKFNHARYYFCHNNHSLVNMEFLEPGYDWDGRTEDEGFARGLNLTRAVREGVLAHTSMGYRGVIHERASFNKSFEADIHNLAKINRETKGFFFPGSLEAQVVRIADDIAQRVHDLEDGMRSAILKKDDIRTVLKDFIDNLKLEIFSHRSSDEQPQLDPKLLAGDHVEHKYFHTRIWKLFVDDVISRLKEGHPESLRSTSDELTDRISVVNRKLKEGGEYLDNFILAAQVAFLLHMWRDHPYLERISEEEYASSTRRVFKYLKLIKEILETPSEEYPAYHIIAFLRGCMLANVVEHSFWKIHFLLNREFRHYGADSVKEDSPIDDGKWYVVFVLTDGLIKNPTADHVEFQSVGDHDDRRRYCFSFDSEDEMKAFCDKHFGKILGTNGSHLKKLEKDKHLHFLTNVCWLNKSEQPGKTRYIRLIGGGMDRQVRIDKVQVYFTGYKELCPGIESGACRHVKRQKVDCMQSKHCQFWSREIKYPDTTRLIEFQGHMQLLDSALKRLISERIHASSSVARMNYMGEKIIRTLLDVYFHNPRLMHDRVWSRLRTYPGMTNVSRPLHEWIDKPMREKEGTTLPSKAFKSLTDPNDSNSVCNQFSLAMRIIEHLAGMTDRYISNEYNRLRQSGKEIERQDETYFFY